MRARAEARFGVVTKAEASECGLTDRMVHKRVKAGVLVPRQYGIYVLAGVPPTWEQDLMIACLQGGPGSAVSHRSAAKFWGLPGGSDRIVEITSPRHIRCPHGTLHRSRLPIEYIRTKRGIPVTDPSRTLCDLGSVVSAERLEEALDAALVKGLSSHDYLKRRFMKNGGKGVKGSAVLRKIL